MDLVEISQLSDKDLFKMCQSNGINVGPVGPTTRKLYDKKLFKVLQNKANSTGEEQSQNEKLTVGEDMAIPLQRKSISQYLGLDETPKSYTRPSPNPNYMSMDTPRTHKHGSGEGDAASSNNEVVDDENQSEGSFHLDKISDNESDSEKYVKQLSSSAYMSVTKSGTLKRRPLHQSVLDDSVFANNIVTQAQPQDNEYESAALISTKVKLIIVFVVIVFVYLVFESMEPEPATPALN